MNVGLMVAIFLLSSVLYYFLIRFILIHELDEDLVERKHKIEHHVAAYGSLPSFSDLDDVNILYKKVATPGSSKVKYQLVKLFNRAERKKQGYRELEYFQQVGNDNYNIAIAMPLEGMHDLLRVIVGITSLTILLIIIATILLNRLLLKKLWKPFYETITTLRLFKIGKKQKPVFPETDIDEFVFLKDNLEQTINSAQDDYHLLKEFTENASHEFQTPLAIIRSKLDLLIQEENLSERQSVLLGQTYGSIKKLARLNQALLLLTKIENHQFQYAEELDLKDKIREKLDQFSELWQNNEIMVTADLTNASVSANPELIEIMLNNILSNASKHNVYKGEIGIFLNSKRLVVENTAAAGELDRKKIFRRFYKEEQTTQSNGLGLSIVKEICDLLGIRISYSFGNNKHRFVLTFPDI